MPKSTASTPKTPFSITPASVEGNAVYLIVDGHDTIVATAFDQPAAEFVADRLNGRVNPLTYNPYISAMLAAFRLHLDYELGAPTLDQPLPIGDLLIDLADWFSLCTGERAMSLGPDLLVYDALQGDRVYDQLVEDAECVCRHADVAPSTVALSATGEGWGGGRDRVRIINCDPVAA